MTLDDLRQLPLLQTSAIAASWNDSPETLAYLSDCVNRFYRGDYGEVPKEDVDANNSDLRAGEGHILARYEGKYSLEGDIYTEAYFYDSVPDMDYNHVMVVYCVER